MTKIKILSFPDNRSRTRISAKTLFGENLALEHIRN